MNVSAMARLGRKHAQNAAAEAIYIKSGIDVTKPVAFYGIVNERCNVKCRYCSYWRLDHYVPEMTDAEWQQALLSVRDFVGGFSINFSGGEPLTRKGFIDLLAWCHDNGILAGVTTNGSALSRRNVEKLVAAKPFNINISVDAPSAELHDHLRGAPGLFEKLSQGIRYLVEERERQGVDFPIVIKPTINLDNFRSLPALIEWAVAIGATSISPQPLLRDTPETYDELWIPEANLAELDEVMQKVIAMKRAGAPVLAPESVLARMCDHFRGVKASPEMGPCRVGLRNFIIKTNGDVEVCNLGYPVIGNVKTQSAREIWYSEQARATRRDTVACGRLCLSTALSQKTVGDKVRMGMQLLKRAQAA